MDFGIFLLDIVEYREATDRQRYAKSLKHFQIVLFGMTFFAHIVGLEGVQDPALQKRNPKSSIQNRNKILFTNAEEYS